MRKILKIKVASIPIIAILICQIWGCELEPFQSNVQQKLGVGRNSKSVISLLMSSQPSKLLGLDSQTGNYICTSNINYDLKYKAMENAKSKNYFS